MPTKINISLQNRIKTWYQETEISKETHNPIPQIDKKKLDEQVKEIFNKGKITDKETFLQAIKERYDIFLNSLIQKIKEITKNKITDEEINGIEKMLKQHLVFLIQDFDFQDTEKELKAFVWYTYALYLIFNSFTEDFIERLQQTWQQEPVYKKFQTLVLGEWKSYDDIVMVWWCKNIIFILTLESRSNLMYSKDTRNWTKFLFSLIEAWATEEIFIEWFNNNLSKSNLVCWLDWWDKDRFIWSWLWPKNKVSGAPDVQILSWDKVINYIEVQKSFYNPDNEKWISVKVHKLKKASQLWSLIFIFFPHVWKFVLLDPKNEFNENKKWDNWEIVETINLPVSQDESRGNKLVYKFMLKEFEHSWLYDLSTTLPKEIIKKIIK